MDLQPILENDLLLLRPLQESDFDELYAVASDRLIWEQHPRRDRYKRDVFEALFEDSLKSGGALVVIDKNTSKIIGSSRYYDVNLSKSEIVIGFTFLARAYWGGRYNKELKALMIQHAFKYFDNILFHVDENNHRSRRAMEKIGGHVSSEIVKPERKVLVYRVPKTLIETSRLVFTPLHLDHLDHFYEMERDPEVLKYYRRKVANDIDEAKENLQ